MKKLAIALAFLALAGCSPNREGAKPAATDMTQNGYQVQKLFEYDGCKVYSFHDNRTIHYANCSDGGAVTTQREESCGKGCTRKIITTTSKAPHDDKS